MVSKFEVSVMASQFEVGVFSVMVSKFEVSMLV